MSPLLLGMSWGTAIGVTAVDWEYGVGLLAIVAVLTYLYLK